MTRTTPTTLKESECWSCGAPIIWCTTASGKRMPLNPEPQQLVVLDSAERGHVRDCYVPHFATCPHASAHRRKEVRP